MLPCFFSVFFCTAIYSKNSGKGQKFDFAADLENGVAPRIPGEKLDVAGVILRAKDEVDLSLST